MTTRDDKHRRFHNLLPFLSALAHSLHAHKSSQYSRRRLINDQIYTPCSKSTMVF
jgi:hypothetical protein